jgi:putative PIN family toxin of toxin-antitoxin system
MLRLVLDTNVVLDLLHWREVAVQPIYAAIAGGRAAALADRRTLAELERVLAYREFGLEAASAHALAERYCEVVRYVPDGAAPVLPRCRDRDDQMFLELAARGQADLLVSRDKALLGLRGRTRLTFAIVPPATAVAALAGRPAERFT